MYCFGRLSRDPQHRDHGLPRPVIRKSAPSGRPTRRWPWKSAVGRRHGRRPRHRRP
ncbi:MAG: hypothetical protein MZU79_02875 [Anaerotruncus sp.]|nr:hypothetical protein [Anaerotruncus sp.]